MDSLGKAVTILVIVVTLVDPRTMGEPLRYTRHTFENCRLGFIEDPPYCCIPAEHLKGPILDFVPQRDYSKPLRLRKALQCLEGAELETYTQKLRRGYDLMRALPENDTRSFAFQNKIHCSYGTGALLQDATDIPTDIHFNFVFYPWHRFFMHFHERILQNLLDDPEFSIHYWNYDNSFTVPAPPGSSGCFKAGHFFPPLYQDPSKSTYCSERLPITNDPTAVVDFVTPLEYYPGLYPRLSNEEIIVQNRATMHEAMMIKADTARAFYGRTCSVGDRKGEFPQDDSCFGPIHVGVHYWIKGYMGTSSYAAFDPIFYAHHSNVDRIWTRWKGLRPGRADPIDNHDWMNVEFLMWDENQQLRRMKIGDSLSHEAFGYTYQEAYDESWISPDQDHGAVYSR